MLSKILVSFLAFFEKPEDGAFRKLLILLVGTVGFEPATSTVSG